VTTTDPTPTHLLDDATLLDEIRQALTRRVPALTGHQADALTLWIAATHAPYAWQNIPPLLLVGPQGTGKTTLLNSMLDLADNPAFTLGSARGLCDWHGTLLIDDLTDTLNPRHSKLGRRLCQGRRPGGTLPLAVALATHTEPPAAIACRALVIRLCASTTPPNGDRAELAMLPALRDWHWRYRDVYPGGPIPTGPAARFLPLLDVADHTGQAWPNRARAATGATSITDACGSDV
jgi:hypothetical protein